MADEADRVRVSNLDRERVLGILHDAFSQGRIDVNEYTERCERTMTARTVGDLRPLTGDLPVEFTSGVPAPLGGEVVEWKGSFGSLKRSGVWTVPAKIVLHRRMGSIQLDFTDAQFTTQLVEIELDIIGGSVEIRVPETTDVATEQIDVVLGSVEDHRKAVPAGGQPRLRISGTLRAGSFEIRGPKRKLFG
jgi:hypothetical protein